jgi:multidrug efflux system membrane fusion protein
MGPKGLSMSLIAALALWLAADARAEDKKGDLASPARPADELRFTGRVQAATTAALSSRIAGMVDKVNVDEGDRVKKGQVLIELSAPELKDDLDAATARLDQAKAEVEQAEAAVQEAEARAKTADAARDAAAAEIARARAGVKVAQAGVEVAQAAVRRAQTQLGFTRIIAPFDGVVERRTVDVGTTVGPQRQGESASLVTVIQDDPVHVVFDVDEGSISRVPVGVPVFVRRPSEGKGLKGKVAHLAASLDVGNGLSPDALRADILLPNADGKLRPGTFVLIEVESDRTGR